MSLLCPSSGLYPVQKTTWFTFGTFRQKRLYRNYKGTQVGKSILSLLIEYPSCQLVMRALVLALVLSCFHCQTY